ncbi:hypothetical protein PR202_ga16770 [Eleusine coracana subsp. coracana]|uniref:Uncharacterized protein n=1 Tax=Eleusine coracana subsp. coracana TaxID=191504 RepID=A0AAV5CP31_ELECO|nr:hypothetical protein PR202_ga16770 [Eleusine coracana subsp. coracana]
MPSPPPLLREPSSSLILDPRSLLLLSKNITITVFYGNTIISWVLHPLVSVCGGGEGGHVCTPRWFPGMRSGASCIGEGIVPATPPPPHAPLPQPTVSVPAAATAGILEALRDNTQGRRQSLRDWGWDLGRSRRRRGAEGKEIEGEAEERLLSACCWCAAAGGAEVTGMRGQAAEWN